MSDNTPPYVPSMRTITLESFLRDEDHCIKGACTNRTCIWKTPKGNGFMVPNPANVPAVPVWTLTELREIIRQLDSVKPEPGIAS